VFPTLRNASIEDSMQIADIQFEGSIVPEPSTWMLAAMGLAGVGIVRRRRK
jgi:hypothetical protein